MFKIAILGNDKSSMGSSRMELVEALHMIGVQPYSGRIWDGKKNEYFRKETAILFPIIASRSNTNPFIELLSSLSVAKQIRKNKIDSVIIYGVKNHAAMAIGSWIGGARKILCVVNGSGNLFRISGFKGKLIRLMAFPMLRKAYNHSTSICFQNTDDLELFRKKKLIKNQHSVFVTGGSGVNLEAFPFVPIPEENRFLFLSRITATKGLKEYCEASRFVKEKYPEAVFDIVGPLDATIESGGIKGILDKAIADGIVKYHGFTDNVASWLQKCRFFIYPSYYPEGVPRCVLQALSTGRPVITCNTPGCKETVEDGKNGLIVEPKSVDKLVAAMIWMIENPEKVNDMSQYSRDLAKRKFNVKTINNIIISKLSK